VDQADKDQQGRRRHGRPRACRVTEEPEKLWDAVDVAEYLNTSISWVYKAAAEGNLPVVRVPGLTRVRFIPSLIRAVGRGEWRPADVIPLKAG